MHVPNNLQRFFAELVAIHADEPLFGGAEDGRLVTAPAVGITVLDVLGGQQRAARAQKLSDDRVRFPNGLADQLFGKATLSAFGVKKAAGFVHRAINRDSVLTADLEIFMAVAGCCVDGASALLQRDVLGQNAERVTLEEWMAEYRVLES